MFNPRTTPEAAAVCGHDPNWELLSGRDDVKRDELDERITERTSDTQVLVPEDFRVDRAVYFRRKIDWLDGELQYLDLYYDDTRKEYIICDQVPMKNEDDIFGLRIDRAVLSDALDGLELIWRASYTPGHWDEAKCQEMKAGYDLLGKILAR